MTEEPTYVLRASDPDASAALLELAQRKRDQGRAMMTQNERTTLLRAASALEEVAWSFQEYAKATVNAG